MCDTLKRDIVVIGLAEVSSSFVTGFEGFPIFAEGLRNLISVNGKDTSYQDHVQDRQKYQRRTQIRYP